MTLLCFFGASECAWSKEADCIFTPKHNLHKDGRTPLNALHSMPCTNGDTLITAYTTCNSNNTSQFTDDFYTVTVNTDGTGLGSGYDISGVYGGNTHTQTGLTYDTEHVLTVNIPIGTHIDLTVTDTDTDVCFTKRILSPGSCSGIFTCWAIADEGNPDVLFKYDSDSGMWTQIGSTGRFGVEAVAFDPFNGILYTASDDQFGRADTLAGTFINIGTGVGIMSGPEGDYDVADIDGLTFDPNSGILWASERRSAVGTDNDYIFQIDPTTGNFIPDAFGVGIDYIVAQEVFDPVINRLVYDVDDIAIDPATSELYVISNQGGSGGMLTVIDKTNGSVKEVIGNFAGVNDIEGLGFYNSGLLYGTTGKDSPNPNDNNKIYSVNKVTATLVELSVVDPTDTQKDYESCDCMTGGVNLITGTVFFDADLSSSLTNGEIGEAGIVLELYLDIDGDGILTPDVDILVNTTQTDADGDYSFTVASTANYIVRTDVSTLPNNDGMTTDNIETASFVTVSQIDPNNNFGYVLCQSPTVTAAADQTVCAGESPSAFSVTVSSTDGNLTYQWQSSTTDCNGSFTDITDAAADTYTSPPLHATTFFRVIVTNTVGSVVCRDTSNCLTATVNPVPAAVAAVTPSSCDPDNTVPNDDGSITLSGFSPGDTYQYSTGSTFNSAAAVPAAPAAVPNGGVIANNLPNPVNAQFYTVRIINSFGCSTDRTVRLDEITCPVRTDYGDYSANVNPCNNEPCHIVGLNLYLGQSADTEEIPPTSENADGDNDDGLLLDPQMRIVPGNTVRIPVVVYNNTGNAAFLRMWIDWNADGDFTDMNEQITDNSYPFTGTSETVLISVTVPADAVLATPPAVRTRLSTDDANSAVPCGTGTCAADGEIEDYLMQIDCPPPVCLSVQLTRSN